MSTLIAILILLLGLVIGSFLNVCIYRIPENESIVFPPSHCTSCSTPLKPRDLVPVVSFIFCRGRCRYCGGKISAVYPLVELLNGIIYLLLFQKFGLSTAFAKCAIFASLLIVISLIDLKTQEIPDRLVLFGLFAGIAFRISGSFLSSMLDGFIGLLMGGAVFLLIAVVGKGAMGGGDIKLVAAIGMYLGWKLNILVMFLSFIIGAIASIILLLFKLKKRKDFIPFGPFIAIAGIIAAVWGNNLINWYLLHYIH